MAARIPTAHKTGPLISPARRYGRFLVVGMMNALVDIIVFNVLMFLMPSPKPWIISLFNTFAVIAAIANSYVWNRHWTFADVSNGTHTERRRFVAQAMLNIFLNDLIVFLVSTYLTNAKSLTLFAGGNLSKGLAMFVSSTISYIVLRKFVFRKVILRTVDASEPHTGSSEKPQKRKNRKWLFVASWGTVVSSFGAFFVLWQTISTESIKPVAQASTTSQSTTSSSATDTTPQSGRVRHHHRRDASFGQSSGSDFGSASGGDVGGASDGSFGDSNGSLDGSNGSFGGSDSSSLGDAGSGGGVTLSPSGGSDFTSSAS